MKFAATLPCVSRRGAALIILLVMFPAALVVFATALSQLDINYADALRNERRAQAQLLAESAVALLQASPASAAALKHGKPLTGEMAGAGRYEIAVASNDPRKLLARGETFPAPYGPRVVLFSHEIELEITVPKDSKTPLDMQILRTTRRVEVR